MTFFAWFVPALVLSAVAAGYHLRRCVEEKRAEKARQSVGAQILRMQSL